MLFIDFSPVMLRVLSFGKVDGWLSSCQGYPEFRSVLDTRLCYISLFIPCLGSQAHCYVLLDNCAAQRELSLRDTPTASIRFTRCAYPDLFVTEGVGVIFSVKYDFAEVSSLREWQRAMLVVARTVLCFHALCTLSAMNLTNL